MKSINNRAIFILENSNDGDSLTPKELWITENAINGLLNNNGINTFHRLYDKYKKHKQGD